jgi:transposase
MEYYAGIDVSLKESSVCVVDTAGKVVREVKVASEPEALVRYFDELGLPVSCIGLEMLCCWRRGMSKRRCPP